METDLHRISEHYKGIPKYVAGPVANLQAKTESSVKRLVQAIMTCGTETLNPPSPK